MRVNPLSSVLSPNESTTEEPESKGDGAGRRRAALISALVGSIAVLQKIRRYRKSQADAPGTEGERPANPAEESRSGKSRLGPAAKRTLAVAILAVILLGLRKKANRSR